MTVKELIDKLMELDPSMPVLIQGYEGGEQDVTRIELGVMRKDCTTLPKRSYYGPHAFFETELEARLFADEGEVIIPAVRFQ